MFALKRPLLNVFILSALLAGGAAVPAFADSAAPAMEKTDQAEARIKTLHDALKVTAAQETQWAPLAQIMRENGEKMSALIKARKANAASMNAIRDIKSYQALTQAHADGLAKFAAAFEPFYNSLTAGQRKAADVFFSDFRAHADQPATAEAPAKKQ